MIHGRSRLTTYEQTEYVKPGKTSSLTAAPPAYTTDLLFAGKGAWLIGDEILQVRDWVAEGMNWRGSYLIRGRLDTPPAAHSVSARAVFLGKDAHFRHRFVRRALLSATGPRRALRAARLALRCLGVGAVFGHFSPRL